MMMSFEGKTPLLDEGVYVAPTAVIIGEVRIRKGASIWFNAVIRGDMAPIDIGAGTNVQDHCTLHTDPGLPLTIGADVTIGHNAVIHGCTIEDHVLIGMHASIMNRAVIRSGSVVAAGALVREGQQVGPCHLVAGVPAVLKKDLQGAGSAEIGISAIAYQELSRHYAAMTEFGNQGDIR